MIIYLGLYKNERKMFLSLISRIFTVEIFPIKRLNLSVYIAPDKVPSGNLVLEHEDSELKKQAQVKKQRTSIGERLKSKYDN